MGGEVVTISSHVVQFKLLIITLLSPAMEEQTVLEIKQLLAEAIATCGAIEDKVATVLHSTESEPESTQ